MSVISCHTYRQHHGHIFCRRPSPQTATIDINRISAVAFYPSPLRYCWLGDRKAIHPVTQPKTLPQQAAKALLLEDLEESGVISGKINKEKQQQKNQK